MKYGATVELIGTYLWPSLSPVMLNYGFRALELTPEEWCYGRLAVPYIEDEIERIHGLAELLDERAEQGIKGLAVTIPYKQDVLRTGRVEAADEIVEVTGVANTLVNRGDGSWAAFNTDVAGVAGALQSREVSVTVAPSLVIGAGATALSACWALIKRGGREVTVAARRFDQAEDLAAKLETRWPEASIRPLALEQDPQNELMLQTKRAGLLINTTPVGQTGTALVGKNPLKLACVKNQTLMDVIYDPTITPFLRQAVGNLTCRHITGLEMLAHQAAAQLAIFTGEDIPEGERQIIAKNMLGAAEQERLLREAERRHNWQ